MDIYKNNKVRDGKKKIKNFDVKFFSEKEKKLPTI